jgi:hypothetical protein
LDMQTVTFVPTGNHRFRVVLLQIQSGTSASVQILMWCCAVGFFVFWGL